MSDETELTKEMFRDQVWQRFEGRTEPVTVSDLARLYRSVLVIHDELMTVTDLVLNQRRLNLTEIIQMKERHSEIINSISEGLIDLDKRIPEDG